MSADTPENECPNETLMQALSDAADDARRLVNVDMLLESHPSDARLHFLKGSFLAGLGRYEEGRAAMTTAVAIAPAYGLARFQLGLLEFSSGDAPAAFATWGPLELLDRDEPLRLFAEGLKHLARDEFVQALNLLERGLAANQENPALNGDMQMIIDGVREVQGAPSPEPVSGAHLLLQQYAIKSTKH